MKVIMVMVATVNGKITRGDDPDIYSWTSKEDADFFFSLLNQHNLVVMGSSTFEAARDKILRQAQDMVKPAKERLRVVLTRNPEKYANEALPGRIEFSSESPETLVERLEKQGYSTMLLVGGGKTNALFLKDSLVDELYLTIEPRLFGEGKPLIAEGEYYLDLRLQSCEKLNEQGTLLLKYSVVYL